MTDLNPVPTIEGIVSVDIPELPEVLFLDIQSLRINDAYQRSVLKTGKGLVKRIAGNFKWSRFGAVVVSDLGNGTYSIIDGQHRVCAALAIGAVVVPCVVTAAQSLEDQAFDFIGINVDRTAMTPAAKFKARLVAGEEIACAINEIANSAGCTVLTYPKSTKNYVEGDLACFAALERIYKRAPHRLRTALEICKTLAPIPSGVVLGVDNLLYDPLLRGEVEIQDMKAALNNNFAWKLRALQADHRVKSGDTGPESWVSVLYQISCDSRDQRFAGESQ